MLSCRSHDTGGSYANFAGKEVARALGKMSMDAKDCSAKVDDLTPEQLKTLEDWEAKLKAKYPIVGKVGFLQAASRQNAISWPPIV